MAFFKRSATDRDLTFRVPDYNCFACNDSGIVHNSDGYLSNELPGYDQNHDLAIIVGVKLLILKEEMMVQL